MSASDPYSVECVLDGSQAASGSSAPAKERISSLAVHGEKLYVGRPSGALAIYRLPAAASTAAASSTLSPDASAVSTTSSSADASHVTAPQASVLSTHTQFHSPNKAVLNLRIVPSLSLILSLCSDGALHFNHLATIEPVKAPPIIASQAAKGIYTYEVQTNIVDWPRDEMSADLSSPTADGSRTFRAGGTSRGMTASGSSGSIAARSQRPMSMFARQRKEDKAQEKQPNFRLVTTLLVSIRRKLLVLRWLDGEPWDFKELPLPHSPRSLTLAPSNAMPQKSSPQQPQMQSSSSHVFMSYGTPNDYAVLEIPPASDSSVYQQQTLAQGVGEKRQWLREEKQWGKMRELNIPAYTAAEHQHGDMAPTSASGGGPRTASPAPSTGGNEGRSGAASTAAAATAAASAAGPSTAGLLSGLGGYIGLGPRSKLPILRAVPRLPPSKQQASSDSSTSATETEVLLVRDNTAVFLSATTGNPTRRRGLDWSAAVDDVALLPAQHLFAALPSGGSHNGPTLQVRSTKTLEVVQSMALPTTTTTTASSSTAYTISSLFAPPSQMTSAAASNNLYAVLTPTSSSSQESAQVYKLTPRPWRLRLREMIRQRMWEGAIELVRDGITESEIEADDNMGLTVGADVKTNLLKPLHALLSLDRFLAGCNLHARKQTGAANAAFEEAVDTWIDLDLNPAKVLSIFPEKIAGNGLSRPQKDWTKIWGEELVQEGFAMEAVVEPLARVKASSAGGAGSRRGSTSGAGVGSAIARDRSRLAGMFGRASRPSSIVGEPSGTDGRAASVADSVPMSRSPTRADAANSTANAATTSASPPIKDVDMDDSNAPFEVSKASLEALGRFLADRRRIFKPILEARPRVTPVAISSVMSLPSVPLSKMSIEELTALAKVVDTALFKTFLETKPSLVGPLCRIENWCEVAEVEELLEAKGKTSELIALYGGKAMHGKALKLLKSLAADEDDEDEKVGPTIRYLQNLGPEHVDVILDSAQWVLQQDRQRGMEIFTADTGKVSLLPRLEVVKLLASLDADLCAQYLEHIIHDVGEASPEIHERLAGIYLDRVLSKPSSASLQQEYHDKLHEFLYESQQYRPERILGKVPPDSLWDIRAVLLGRMGQHRGALSIYVEKIGGREGEDKAEAYCADVWDSHQDDGQGDDDTRNIFLLLLKLYLQQQRKDADTDALGSDAEDRLAPALRLISNHATRLDLTAVLDLLPPMISLTSIQQFLVKGLQTSHRNCFDRRILASIGKERSLQLDEKVNAIRSRRVKITHGRTCPVCGKRLGVSVLAVTHRGEVLHYGCRQQQESR